MRRISLAFTLLLTMLVISSCSKGSDDGEFTPSGGNGSLRMTIGAMSPSLACEVIAASQDGSEVETRFSSKWGDNATCEVWAKQSGELVYLGKQNVAITSSDKQKGEVNIDGTGKLDASKPYEVIGLGCSWRRDGNELYYRTDLHRGGNFGLYFKTVSGQWSVETSSRVAGTAEILYVINKTDKPVKFRHRGFDAEQKWYYTHAEVSIDNGIIVNTEQEGDAVSEEGEVPVFTGKNAFKVFSYYVPNGNKIQNAQLIAEIDGKEVRSENRINSDITLQTDHAYGIFAVWDGEKLTLGESKGNGVIELPEGGNVNMNDVTIYGDGEIIKLNQDGTFSTTANSLMALGKNNQAMYLCYASFEDDESECSIELNATETAVSMLLPVIPYVFYLDSDELLNKLKGMIRNLSVTATLANAIEKSVAQKGYLDIDDIWVEYEFAMNYIVSQMGLNDANRSTRRSDTPMPNNLPSLPDIPANVRMRFFMKNAQWSHGPNPYDHHDQAYWKTTFTVTSTRLANMAVVPGFYENLNGEEVVTLYPMKDEMELFDNIIAAYSSKAVFERLTSFEGFYELYDRISMSWEDGHVYSLDETMEDISMNFYSENDCVVILGPMASDLLLAYHIMDGIVCPAIKLVGGEINKILDDEASEEKFDLNRSGMGAKYKKFLVSLVLEFAKEKKIEKIKHIINSDISNKEKAQQLMSVAWETIQKKIVEDFKKSLTKDGSALLFKIVANKVTNIDGRIKELDDMLKTEKKIWKYVFSGVDIWIARFGIFETPRTVIGVNLDFNIPTIGLNDLPGDRY